MKLFVTPKLVYVGNVIVTLIVPVQLQFVIDLPILALMLLIVLPHLAHLVKNVVVMPALPLVMKIHYFLVFLGLFGMIVLALARPAPAISNVVSVNTAILAQDSLVLPPIPAVHCVQPMVQLSPLLAQLLKRVISLPVTVMLAPVPQMTNVISYPAVISPPVRANSVVPHLVVQSAL